MSKINLDKYYTDVNIAKQCIDTVFSIIGESNISHIIEPSAGNGSFSLQLECAAYDIEPEHPSIKKQDFLTLDTTYQKGRLIIGNPPFGDRMSLAQQIVCLNLIWCIQVTLERSNIVTECCIVVSIFTKDHKRV